MTITSIDRYIATLRAGAALDDDTAAELRGHLEDAANDLQMGGLNPAESAREAMRRFGPPDDIGMAFARAHAARRPFMPIMRRPRSLVVALVAALALAILGGSAVAAARTPGQSSIRQVRAHSHPYHPSAPADTRATTENH